MINKQKIIALIVAAGSGTRFGSDLPKQYTPLAGQAILRYSIDVFQNHPLIEDVYVIYNPSHKIYYDTITRGLILPPPITGGNDRQISVYNGLKSIQHLNPSHVLIHDGARPFVSSKIITDIYNALQDAPAAIPVTPVTDTLKQVNHNNLVEKTIPRLNLYATQTPQAFDFNILLNLHEKYKGLEHTDDASLCEHDNIKTQIVLSDKSNIKITTAEDLKIAENFLQSKKTDVDRIERHG